MATTLVSTTDTAEDMAATAKMYDLEAFDTAQDEGGDPMEPAAAADAATEVPPAPASTTAAAPAPAEPTTQEEEPPRDEQGRFKSRKLQGRFDELTWAKNEAERKRESAEQKLADLQRQVDDLKKPEPKVEAKPEPKPVFDKPKPKRADFMEADDPDADFFEALSDWKTEKATFDLKAELTQLTQAQKQAAEQAWAQLQQTTTEQQESADRKAAFDDRFEAAKEAFPNLEETWKAAENVMLSAPLFDALGDHAGDEVNDVYILEWLCRNPDEAKRISEATNYDPKTAKPAEILRKNRQAERAVMEIVAEIQASQEKTPAEKPPASAAPAPPANPKPRVTRAPAPIEPPRSGGTPGGEPDPSKMTSAQYLSYLRTDRGKAWYTGEMGFSDEEWKRTINAR
jgi:hypothetical protein